MRTAEPKAAEGSLPLTEARWRVPIGPDLPAADALFRRLLEAAPDGIVAVHHGGRIALANMAPTPLRARAGTVRATISARAAARQRAAGLG